MIIAGIGILLSIVGCLMVRCGDKSDMKTMMKSLTKPLWFSTAAIAGVTAIMAKLDIVSWGVCGSVAAGLVAGCVIGLLTEYYTSDAYGPTKGIAEQAKMGPATAIIDGLAVGMFSMLLLSGCGQSADLSLKFSSDRATTYKATTEMTKLFRFEQPNLGKLKEEQTKTLLEVAFTQTIQGVDADGNATAEIMINDLKVDIVNKNECPIGEETAN